MPTLVPDGNPYAEEDPVQYFKSVDHAATVKRGHHYADTAASFLGHAGKMLEVGCGLGLFLVGARERGWEVRGIDLTQSFVDEARKAGVECECAAPENSTFMKERYDCILLLNILEHLYEPMKILSLVSAALNPGGVVAIGVPNEGGLTASVGNAYFKLRGLPWSMNLSPTFPPFHVIGFSPRSLRTALESCGLEVLRLKTVSGTNESPPSTGLVRNLERLGIGLSIGLAPLLGRGDAIDCWARKPHAK